MATATSLGSNLSNSDAFKEAFSCSEKATQLLTDRAADAVHFANNLARVLQSFFSLLAVSTAAKSVEMNKYLAWETTATPLVDIVEAAVAHVSCTLHPETGDDRMGVGNDCTAAYMAQLLFSINTLFGAAHLDANGIPRRDSTTATGFQTLNGGIHYTPNTILRTTLDTFRTMDQIFLQGVSTIQTVVDRARGGPTEWLTLLTEAAETAAVAILRARFGAVCFNPSKVQPTGSLCCLAWPFAAYCLTET